MRNRNDSRIDIKTELFMKKYTYKKLVSIRSSHLEVFLGKGVLKICTKFAGEHPCLGAISIKLLCNFTEITPWHGCSPANLLHVFRTSFPKNPSGRPLLYYNQNLVSCNMQTLASSESFSSKVLHLVLLFKVLHLLLLFCL